MVREQADMIAAWQEGRIDDARDLGKRVQRLADVVFDAPVANYRVRLKESLHMLGVPGLESTAVRPPLLPLDDDEKQRLTDVLVEVGLLEGANV
jgi:dihydrodipicolinate synthase/N-acetylneuraminate lyase